MNREMQFGIKITADGKIAVAEFDEIRNSSRRVSDQIVNDNQKIQRSAKEIAMAYRQLPMQMTDIWTGLASGQSPLMVLMQQGGQLKDMFGGIGPAARAVGGELLKLVNPYTLVAAAIGGLGVAYLQGQKEAEEYAKAIIMTGNQAGVTVGQLQGMAASIASTTGATTGAAAEVITALVATGKVGAEQMASVAEAALRMERAGGQSVDTTVKQFAELGNKPVEASLKLNEATGFLTFEIYQQIKALEDQGRKSEAAAVAQSAAADTLDKQSKQIAESLGALQIVWNMLADDAKKAWNAMLDVGRDNSLPEKLIEAQIALNKARAGVLFGGSVEDAQRRVDEVRAAIEAEEAKTRATKKATDAEAAKIAISREAEKYLTKQEQLERELTKVRNMAAAAGYSVAQTEELLGKVRAKYAGATKGTVDSDLKAYEQLKQAVSAKDLGVSPQTLKNLEMLGRMLDKDAAHAEQYRQAIVFALQNDSGVVAWGKQITAADEAAEKAHKSYMERLDQTVERAKEEYETLGMTKSEVERLTIARLEEKRAKEIAAGADEKTIARLTEEIEARKELATWLRSTEVWQANKKAVEQSYQAWKQMTDDVYKSISDAIMRGGINGRDLLMRAINSLVLTPGIKWALSPIANGIGSMLGYNTNSPVSVGGSLLNAGSIAGLDVTKLLGLGAYAQTGSVGTGLYGAFATSGIGQTLGLSQTTALPVAAEEFIAGGGLGGATTSTTLTGLGSGIASAMPWVAGALALASAFGLFDSGGGPKVSGQGLAVFDNAGGYSVPDTWNISNPTTKPGKWYGTQVWDGAANPQMQGAMNTFADGVAAYLQKLGVSTAGLAFGLGGDTDPQGTAGDFVRGEVVKNGKSVYSTEYEAERGKGQAALTAELKRMMLAAVQASDVPEAIKKRIAAAGDLKTISDTDAETLLNNIGALGTALKDLHGPLLDAANAFDGTTTAAVAYVQALDQIQGYIDADPFANFASSQRTVQAQLEESRQAMLAMAASGSTSMAQLGAAAQSRYQLELALAQQIDGAVKSIQGSHDQARQQIELAGLSNAETYGYWDKKAAQYSDVLSSLTDVTQIQAYYEKLQGAITSAFGTLDAGQQAAERQKFLSLLDQAEQKALDREQVAKDQAASDRKALADEIVASIERSMTPAATQMVGAAGAIAQAASSLASAVGAAASIGRSSAATSLVG